MDNVEWCRYAGGKSGGIFVVPNDRQMKIDETGRKMMLGLLSEYDLVIPDISAV